MTQISEFEVLFSGLIPGVPLPLVAQGYFLQITNLTNSDQTITLHYNETSSFQNAVVKIDDSLTLNLLMANYLDGSGNAVSYPNFLENNGFSGITIPTAQTFVFGLQAFPTPASSLDASHPAASQDPRIFVAPQAISLPTFGIQWHGNIYITCETEDQGQLMIYPTTRGVFFDPIIENTEGQTQPVMTIGITTGQTYSAVPTADGTAVINVPTS